MLRDTVVVHEHGRCPDVGADSDLGVADIRQVRDLRAIADGRVLDLDVRPSLRVVTEHGSGTQICERSDRGTRSDDGQLRPGVNDGRIRADLAGDERAARTDTRTGRHGGGAAQRRVRQDSGIGLDLDIDIEPCRRRIEDRDAVAHPSGIDAIAHDRRCLRELVAVVHAEDLGIVGAHRCRDRPIVSAQQPDDIGEVLLGLRVIGGHPAEHETQRVGRECVHARVHLGDIELIEAGVLVLDDPMHGARGIADDSAVAGWVGKLRREHSRGR